MLAVIFNSFLNAFQNSSAEGLATKLAPVAGQWDPQGL